MGKIEYKNIHTGDVVTIKKRDVVRNNPSDFAVYVLSDGERWQVALFDEHYEEVTKAKAKKS